MRRRTINQDYDREMLARNLIAFRRILWREMIAGITRGSDDFDMSSLQFLTLFLLIGEEELSINQVATFVGRSLSATSRMLDQLVARGLVQRREDEHDRRVKRVSLSERGRSFVQDLEQKRAEAQMLVMAYLSAEERGVVARAMQLLADAARRHADEHREPPALRSDLPDA